MDVPKPRGNRTNWLIFLIMAAGLLGVIVWSMAKEISQNPARDTAADLGSYGLVTIRLIPDPFPLLPTGKIVLNFLSMDSRLNPVELDGIAYEYGLEGNDRPVGSGVAQPMSGNSTFIGNAQFPMVGDWWIKARVTKGDQQADVKFSVYVKPAQ